MQTKYTKVYTIMKAAVTYLLMLQKYMGSMQKSPEIKDCALCIGNISNDFKINNMKKLGFEGIVKFFLLILILLILTISQISINIWWKEHGIK